MSGREGHSWEEDVAAYALGALPEEERSSLEEHLAGCERCRSELQRMTAAVDLLPTSVEQVEPPPALRGRLLAAAREDLSEQAAARRWSWPRLSIPRLRPALAVLAVSAAVGGGVVGYAVRGDEAPVSATVPVDSLAAGSSTSASLVRRGDDWTLRAQELPPLKRDEVFQVWVKRGGAVEPSTVFVADRHRSAVVAIPQDLGEVAEVMVTREPRGGSRTPTSPPLLRARPS